MIKTLQKKFVITAMAAVTVLLVLLLGAINGLNFLQNRQQTERLLDVLAQQAAESSGPGAGTGERRMEAEPVPQPLFPDLPKKGGRDFLNPPITEDAAMAARYFFVRFDHTGRMAETDVSRISSVSEEDAELLAQKIYQGGKRSGRQSHFQYRRVETLDGQGEIVLFLDRSVQKNSMLMVLALSVFLGILCWSGMLLLVILLSKKAILPIARNLEKQKQFVTDAGHEIKTPLAIIMANTEAMELHNGENKWSRNIRTQAARLNGLMQNLLLLARLDEGRPAPAVRELSFSHLIEEVLTPFLEPAALKGVEIETEIQENVQVYANREDLIRLISILLDNAVKYVPPKGKIFVELRKKEKRCTLQIGNTCQEKPAEKPEILFDRFYRGDVARTQKNGGYGIGLSAAQAIAEAYHGKIRAVYQEEKIIFIVQL